jgi:hypothetical protein
MPITLSGAPQELVVRAEMTDNGGESVVKSFSLAGATTDAELIEILTDLDALSNAKIVKASVSSIRYFAGMKASALAALHSKVSVLGYLSLYRVDPINTNKQVLKSFSIPSYVSAVEDLATGKPITSVPAGAPTTPPEHLHRLIINLQSRILYVDTRTTTPTYNTGFTYDVARSGFGSVAREFDGTPTA